MNREKMQQIISVTGDCLTALAIVSLPFAGFWLKYIFAK